MQHLNRTSFNFIFPILPRNVKKNKKSPQKNEKLVRNMNQIYQIHLHFHASFFSVFNPNLKTYPYCSYCSKTAYELSCLKLASHLHSSKEEAFVFWCLCLDFKLSSLYIVTMLMLCTYRIMDLNEHKDFFWSIVIIMCCYFSCVCVCILNITIV